MVRNLLFDGENIRLYFICKKKYKFLVDSNKYTCAY